MDIEFTLKRAYKGAKYTIGHFGLTGMESRTVSAGIGTYMIVSRNEIESRISIVVSGGNFSKHRRCVTHELKNANPINAIAIHLNDRMVKRCDARVFIWCR